jgi:L-iditol 2-dehydrogenase
LAEKMRATALYGPSDLRVEEFDVPKLGPHEVLVKVVADGVCPSGVHAVRNGVQWGPPGVKMPGFPGHEFSGDVVEVGDSVEKIKVGDRVVSDLILRCGRCYYCRTGRQNLCVAKGRLGYYSWAEYIKTIDYQTYKISDDTSYEEAAFTEPLACALHGNLRANIPPGGNVVIIGAGPMGLLHLQLAKNLSGARVIISDLVDGRLKIAKSLGADEASKPNEGLTEKVMEISEGRGADSVIVTVGNPKVQEESIKLVASGGTVLIFAGIHTLGEPATTINPNKIHYGDVDLRGSFDKTADEFVRALKLIELGVVDTKPLVTHRFSLDEVMKAIDAAEKLEGLKVMIRP